MKSHMSVRLRTIDLCILILNPSLLQTTHMKLPPCSEHEKYLSNHRDIISNNEMSCYCTGGGLLRGGGGCLENMGWMERNFFGDSLYEETVRSSGLNSRESIMEDIRRSLGRSICVEFVKDLASLSKQ